MSKTRRVATTTSAHLRSAVEGILRRHEARETALGTIPITLTVGLAPGSSQSADGPDDVVMVAIVGVCEKASVRADVHRELDAALAKLDASYK
jgi:hypothetical protein